MPVSPFTTIDLFAGAGGLSLGFERRLRRWRPSSLTPTPPPPTGARSGGRAAGRRGGPARHLRRRLHGLPGRRRRDRRPAVPAVEPGRVAAGPRRPATGSRSSPGRSTRRHRPSSSWRTWRAWCGGRPPRLRPHPGGSRRATAPVRPAGRGRDARRPARLPGDGPGARRRRPGRAPVPAAAVRRRRAARVDFAWPAATHGPGRPLPHLRAGDVVGPSRSASPTGRS